MIASIAPSHAVSWTARLLWLAPLMLLVYGLFLLKAPLDLTRTLNEGTPMMAEVLHVETSGRKDVTYDYADLAFTLPDGTRHVERNLSLPHTVAPFLVGTDSIPVRVLMNSSRRVIIDQSVTVERSGRGVTEMETHEIPVVRTQIRIAWVSAAVCLISALLLSLAVGWWNRYLARYGDPADRAPEAAQS